ncbi:MAG: putative Peptidase, family [Nitrospira sp.]|nr:putative Peptidase, family [Nitrospira sp.]
MRCNRAMPTEFPLQPDGHLVASSHTRWLFLLIIGTLLSIATNQSFAETSSEAPTPLTQALQLISSDRMLADIRALTGPEFNGRQTGTPDDLASAEFVQGRFLDLHGERSPGSASDTLHDRLPDRTWLQSASARHTTIGQAPLLHLLLATGSPPTLIGTDYLPILDSPSADLQAPLVFVGYGISDPAGGIDEYAGMDVRNKVVLFLRGKPERYGKSVSHADKVRAAQARGAIGFLTATGPILNAYETRRGITGRPSALYGLMDSHETIPGAWISTSLASATLNAHQPEGADRLRILQQHINESLTPRSITLDVEAAMQWSSVQRDGTLHNVISILSGQDPAHQHETIVMGAHRDHFGRQGGLLFAGADDNASGTAVILEVARVLASTGTGLTRSIVLVSFSGEEQGLLGSKFYVAHPIVPLPSTVAMINVDHAGVGNGRLTVGVTGLEKTVAQEAGRKSGLAERLDIFGFFPGGDHVPFKEAGIPTVTIVSGGTHPHFHHPTDTVDSLSPDILTAAAQYVLTLAWQLADTP